MDELLEQGLIKELTGTQNVQYVFEDPSLFSLTEYKVLRSQNKNFIKCSKVLYNGKIKLLYFSSMYKSLRSMIPTLDTDNFLSIIASIIHCIIEIKNNGFLSCNDLDLTLDKVFVEQSTLEVNLIYLPLNNSSSDVSTFENELRSEFIKLISGIPSFAGEKAARVCNYLANGTLSLGDVYQYIKGEVTGATPKIVPHDEGTFGGGGSGTVTGRDNGKTGAQPPLQIVSVNTPVPIQFTVNKPEFVLGKNSAQVDGAITFNKAISRVHCRIHYQNGYYLTDLGSANGTYLNNTRILAHQPRALNSGDTIRLANSDFKIRF